MPATSAFWGLTWLAHYVRPRARIGAVHELDLHALRARGIRGLILDLDNTLVPWNTTRLSAETRAWLRRAQEKGFSLCILSNSSGDSRVQFVGESIGVPYVSKAVKPSRRAFRMAIRQMGLQPREVGVIGDQLLTDVLGGNRLGLLTILVVPVTRRDFIGTKVMRFLERVVRSVLRHVPEQTEDLCRDQRTRLDR